MTSNTYEAGLAQRGQMTLPKPLRDEYNLQEGQSFTILDLGGKFLIVPKKSQVDEICNQLRDQLADSGATLSDMLAEIRMRREREGRVGSTESLP